MDNIAKFWQPVLFIVSMTFAVGRVWSEFQQQNVEIESLKERLEDVNSTLHRRVSGVDDDVEKLQDKVEKNSIDISYLNGKTNTQCLP